MITPLVYGLGQCSLDYLTTVPSYPSVDRKVEFGELVVGGGGPVATALVALSRWGVPCAFAGMVGDDAFGVQTRESLERENIDLNGLMTRAGTTSQFAFIATEPSTGSRTVFWRRPTGAALSPDEIDTDAIAQARVLHTDGLFHEAARRAAQVARASQTLVVVDAGTLREGMLELAALSDVFIVSETFAQQLVGNDDPVAACQRLAALGPRVVGVTRGSRGYVAMEGGTVLERPAHPTHAIDTTGCGDIFHAGLSYGLVHGWPTEKCLDYAAWAAARAATRLGGRAGIPAAEDYHG
jgi:ribokinase